MTIMQQSSRAQDRTLGVWFQHIQQGMVKLPRFQRFEAWERNRIIGKKDPLEYLQERVQWADEAVVRERLKSHLISFDLLAAAHYAGLQGEALKIKLTQDFDRFLRARATLVVAAMKQLVEGQTPSLDALWKAFDVDAVAVVSGSAA